MEKLVLDCSGGARKGQLVDMLLGMLDEEARGAFVRRFGSIGLRGVAAELDGEGRLVVTDDGCTEWERSRSHGHAHGSGGEYAHGHAHGSGADGEHAHAHAHAHEHRSLADVREIVESLSIDEETARDVMGVYGILAEAEAAAHESSVSEVHFHEVGNNFAIASIVAFCMLVRELAPEDIVATPIATGFGYVDCAHGRLPIPAPATANVLEGMPHYAGEVEGELCTPTGAALVRYFTEKPSPRVVSFR